MNNRSVSVIIPFYRHAEWLIEAVESVFQQTYPAKETIVIDDGSDEDLSSFLELYGSKIRYVKTENHGAAAARNLGITISEGDYFAFLDSDDIWLPDKLEKQIKIMEKESAMWSYTAYTRFADETEGLRKKKYKKTSVDSSKGIVFPKILYSNKIATPTVIIDGSILRNNPEYRFAEGIKYGEDQCLWLKLAEKYPLYSVDEVLTKVRIRGDNAALSAVAQIQGRCAIYDNFILESNRTQYLTKTSKLAYNLCKLISKWLKKTEENNGINRLTEFFAGILYIIPWLIFKYNLHVCDEVKRNI